MRWIAAAQKARWATSRELRKPRSVVLDDEVNLKYYRLQKTSEGSISLAPGDHGAVKAPTAVGTGADHHEQIELSRLIDIVNQRFGTEFKPADQLFFDQIREETVPDTQIRSSSTGWTKTRKSSPGT